MSDAALLSTILASPRDDAPRLVLADALLQRGDPLGELIATQCALARAPSALDLEQKELALLASHEDEWLDRLGLQPGEGLFVRGLVEELTVPLERLPALSLPPLPLRCLRITELSFPEEDTLAALRESPLLSRIETLDLTDGQLGEALCQILPALPANVRTLKLWGNDISDCAGAFAEALPPTIVSLDLQANGLDESSVEALVSRLRPGPIAHLFLSYNPIGDEGLEILMRSGLLENLRTLALRGAQLSDAPIKALSSRLRSLVALDLSINQIGDKGVSALASAPCELELLDLGHNRVRTKGARALALSPALAGARRIDLRYNELPKPAKALLAETFGDRALL